MKDGLTYDLPVVEKLTNPMNNLLEDSFEEPPEHELRDI